MLSPSAKDLRRLDRPRGITTLPSVSKGQAHWAVVLAGGDGTRLQGLTLKISGDSRPKQFCSIFGGKSLLSQTWQRLGPLFRSDHMMFVLTRAHERFYREELPPAENSNILVQPENRGTGAAITAAILRIIRSDGDAIVAFFPCDHYYADDDAFALTIQSAMAFAEKHPTSLILLGAQADHPEVEYGWIEPGPAIRDLPLSRVNRFWEKPTLQEAQVLLRRGCLWNTFVTIGRAETFLELLRAEIPDVVSSIAAAVTDKDLDSAYRGVRAVDFSRVVLVPQPHRLLVVRDAVSGWTDFGNPTRVIDTLTRNNIEPAWLNEMRSQADVVKT
jgi:mannose-1-phosphate guanylyltransferase